MKFLAILSLTFAFFLSSAQAEEQSNAIHIMLDTPFSEGHDIRSNIINECTNLGTKLSSFTHSYANDRGIDIILDDQISTTAKGQYLQIEISHAISRGNAFTGHSKFVTIKGTLWRNGEAVASFDGQRSSMGGFMGNYKGSCAVLGRCVKTLGKDIAAWLESSPSGDSSIGE